MVIKVMSLKSRQREQFVLGGLHAFGDESCLG
jgi:hypothetical protein